MGCTQYLGTRILCFFGTRVLILSGSSAQCNSLRRAAARLCFVFAHDILHGRIVHWRAGSITAVIVLAVWVRVRVLALVRGAGCGLLVLVRAAKHLNTSMVGGISIPGVRGDELFDVFIDVVPASSTSRSSTCHRQQQAADRRLDV